MGTLINFKEEDTSVRYYSCADWMQKSRYDSLKNGTYTIWKVDNSSSLEIYCVFDYLNGFAWALIESGSRDVMSSTFQTLTFQTDSAYNEDDVANFKNTEYRLSQAWMDSIATVSDLLLAACDFDLSFSQDWLLFNLTDANINVFETDNLVGSCVDVVSANIRGYSCSSSDPSVEIYHNSGQYHLHFSTVTSQCGCIEWDADDVTSEDDVCCLFNLFVCDSVLFFICICYVFASLTYGIVWLLCHYQSSSYLFC